MNVKDFALGHFGLQKTMKQTIVRIKSRYDSAIVPRPSQGPTPTPTNDKANIIELVAIILALSYGIPGLPLPTI
jgi:hypothetical protein